MDASRCSAIPKATSSAYSDRVHSERQRPSPGPRRLPGDLQQHCADLFQPCQRGSFGLHPRRPVILHGSIFRFQRAKESVLSSTWDRLPAFFQCWHDGKPERSAGCKASAAHPVSARILVEILGLPPAPGQEPQSAWTPALIGLLCVAVRRTSMTYRQGHACATPRQTHLKGSPVMCAALSISSRCTSPQPVSIRGGKAMHRLPVCLQNVMGGECSDWRRALGP